LTFHDDEGVGFHAVRPRHLGQIGSAISGNNRRPNKKIKIPIRMKTAA
jgi:hypothetical protein